MAVAVYKLVDHALVQTAARAHGEANLCRNMAPYLSKSMASMT